MKNKSFTSLYGFPQIDTVIDFFVKADLIATLGRRIYYEINIYLERINQNYSTTSSDRLKRRSCF